MTDDRPPARRLRPFPTVAMYAAIVLAVGQSVLFNVLPDSPLRGGGIEKIASGQNETILSDIAGDVDAKSGGRSIALHTSIPSEMLAGNADKELAGIYYYTAYEFYPRRIYVGEDDRVVNNGGGLLGPHAGRRWLAEHGVDRTFEISADTAGQLRFDMDRDR